MAKEASLIANRLNLEVRTVGEVISLLDEDNTVPFIARYRKEVTRGLDPTVLRQIESLHIEQREVKVKVEKTKKKIGEGLTSELVHLLENAQTSDEIDEIYAPFKKGSKKTLSARAKELGLEAIAQTVLNNSERKDLRSYVNPQKQGIKNIKEVTLGIQHILAETISKNKACIDKLKELTERWPPCLESTISSKAAKDEGKLSKEANKYRNFHNFQKNVKWLKSHQILAINRAEALKILTVKITLNAQIKNNFIGFVNNHWKACQDVKLLNNAIVDAYDRLMAPAICRRERSLLKKKAEADSAAVFTKNLYSLLLASPVKNKGVLALDPGYTNGCKMALLSPTGAVLETGLIFPTGRKTNLSQARSEVVSIVTKHRCETIAIGNGVACRETEMFVSKLIQDDAFSPLEVVYCIVSEDGASVYSASKEAMAELPNLDLSMRGAVSIGRRLQDPLLELVKIEPKHLGIGMYQHDIPDNMLRTALEGVLVDCVSLVGVDINAAGINTLKRVAGLNERKAINILEWREQNKQFVNRTQLEQVKGIGKKSYEQSIGFLKILPGKSLQGSCSEAVVISDDDNDSEDDVRIGSKRKRPTKRKGTKRSKAVRYNYLDSTLIHPESYDLAERLMKKMSVHNTDIGSTEMTQAVNKLLTKQSTNNLAEEFAVGASTIELVIDGLKTPIDHDIRSSFEKPIFKKGLMLFEDLSPGMNLSGRVTNVTTFGAFVDCGVGRDGLIHESQMNKRDEPLSAGDIVEVTVNSIDRSKGHFQLRLIGVRPRLKAHLLTANRHAE